MPLIIGGEKEKKAKELAEQLLEKIGLKDRLYHIPSQLSGGEKQRVSVARALVSKPKCILADEPTGNLDKETADVILNLFLELSKEYNSAIVIVTHDKDLANRCSRSVLMANGIIS